MRRDEIDIKAIAKRLPSSWPEPQPFGADGWRFMGVNRTIFVTYDPDSDPGTPWLHASIGHHRDWRLPGYSDMKELHRGVFGDGHAYQCFVPPGKHINLVRNVLHLFGRADGKPALPDFGREGTI